MRSAESVIKRPILTEKGTALKETGGRPDGDTDAESLRPQFLFEIASNANKLDVRRAVEKLWNVNVVKVRTAVVRGKERRVGKYMGKRSNWKKAVVTLAPGQTIDFFEGV